VATSKWPDETGRTGPGDPEKTGVREEDLERRRRELEADLALLRPQKRAGSEEGAKSGGAAGYGNALKLSSEFIAGIAVGVGLGWAIDRVAGTSPWGLIVFLLLGFGAGVLNVLRSAGLIAQPDGRRPKEGRRPPEKN
jgi:ATP synthase protein I